MIGVLASGEGTNLQALLDAGLPVVAVASNRREARALERASARGIDTAVFLENDFATREERDLALGGWLVDRGAEVTVLAGYMQLLSRPFLELFPERVINVHPSLLPQHPGMNAVAEALGAGEAFSGATVHIVDDGVDTGPIIAQVRVPIRQGDTVQSLHARIQRIEHWLLPHCVSMCLEGVVWPP